jgi:phosphoribosylanthranilate isomerase
MMKKIRASLKTLLFDYLNPFPFSRREGLVAFLEMPIKLKVCGMRDSQNIMNVARLLPDCMGFIFYASSPRFVGNDFQLPDSFPSEVKKVGVFVNALTIEMQHHSKRLGLDYLQLHGNESIDQCKELKDLGNKLIKAFSIGEDFDFAQTKPYKESVDYFLFDTKGKYHGGNAQRFDWSILQKYDQEVPFFLSGGISPDHIVDVLKLNDMNIHAIDVNSGVETNPGLKDIVKIDAIKKLLSNE